MVFDHVHPLLVFRRINAEASEAIDKYFQVEMKYMVAEGYVERNYEILRKNAMRVVLENYKSENFDAFIPYLAMNYFDRYVSNHGLPLPHRGKRVRDEVFLVSLCCLTIAWKMRNDFFFIPQFLEERSLGIKGKHIMEVELKILEKFNWQMRSVTPFCFLDRYVEYLPSDYLIKRRSINEIIIQAQGDIYFTQFKPSIVAASAVLAAFSFLYPTRYPEQRWRFIVQIAKENLVSGFLNLGIVLLLGNLSSCLDRIINLCIKNNISMESAQPVFGWRQCLRIRAGEPTRTAAAASSSSSHKSEVEETKELQRSGGEAEMQPMEKISEVQISHRHGKELMGDASGIHKPMDVAQTLRRSNQIIGTNSEIQEEPENPEQMDFDLKWISEEDENENLTINSPLFRRRFYASGDDIAPNNETGSSLNQCCNVL